MRVITYLSSVTDDAPEARRCAAIILHAATKAHPHGDMHPVVFFGASKQAARAAAETWWEEQIAAERRKQEGAAKRSEAMRAARAGKAPAAQVETTT